MQYHYYNQWMRQRLAGACPGLPEPVVLRLLALDAGDLDLMLQHPLGAQAQVGGGAGHTWLWAVAMLHILHAAWDGPCHVLQ